MDHFYSKNKMKCELMLTYDTLALWQTGSSNVTGPKLLPTIWHTYMKLVTKYQISVINSCLEKCDEKYLGWTEVVRGCTKIFKYRDTCLNKTFLETYCMFEID